MFFSSTDRAEARDLVAAQGSAAILELSDRMIAAVRAGNDRAALRLDRMLRHAEALVDGS
jgi:hypothetical protein